MARLQEQMLLRSDQFPDWVEEQGKLLEVPQAYMKHKIKAKYFNRDGSVRYGWIDKDHIRKPRIKVEASDGTILTYVITYFDSEKGETVVLLKQI